MTQPTNYTPTTDFSQQEAINASGRSTVNTSALDTEFANIETTLDGLVANIALIQRDDGRLADLTVETRCLSQDVLTLMGGFNLRGLWADATAYAVNDICSSGAYTYCCTVAHTSSGSIDLAKWIQFGFTSGADAEQAAAAAQDSATAAAASASSASTSATNAANSASSISGSVSTAAGYASTATTKASEAAASATAAANSATAAANSAASIDTSSFANKTGTNATGTWPVSITGNAATATSATNAATVTNGVYTTGDQTIGGVKTFSSTIQGTAASASKLVPSGSSGQVYKSTGASTDPDWGSTINNSAAMSASGTAVDFTSIPSWAKRIKILANLLSSSGTSLIQAQLGTASGFETTGYTSTAVTSSGTATSATTGLLLVQSTIAATSLGIVATLDKLGATNTWMMDCSANFIGSQLQDSAGSKSLGDVLTQLRITTVNGTDTFDAGTVAISWE